MSASDDFLSRWSRRKLEVRAEPAVSPVSGPPAPENPAESADAPADLPSLDDVTADSNLTAFLSEKVPAALRNAALRRAWSLDPAIRDYIGDARDYAYDWNVPDGVPGFGPINAAYDVEGTIARMWAGPPEEVVAEEAPAGEAAAALDDVVPSEAAQPADEDEPAGIAKEPDPESASPDRLEADVPPGARRRHGGATPT